MPVSFVHLNIEKDKHLDRIAPFLKETMPDVVCLQELFQEDVPFFEEVLGARSLFVPMMRNSSSRGEVTEGVGMFLKTGFTDTTFFQYGGKEGDLALYVDGTPEEKEASQRYVLALAHIEKDGEIFQIGTTHFPVTVGGMADDIQRKVASKFLSIATTLGDIVITGDFNAPRGREIFTLLAEHFTDNVPPQFETSLDGNLHRAGPLPYMVDGIFSTPGYSVSDVEMVCGVSDHCALTGIINKA